MDFPKYVRKSVGFVDKKDPLNELRANEIAGQNIVTRLAGRELWGGFGRRIGTERYLQRSMYQSIYPNFTVTHVEKPPCFLRKFTPDGKYFVAFSADQMSVEVYYFQGPQAANHLFVQMGKEWETSALSDIGEPPPEKKARMVNPTSDTTIKTSEKRIRTDPYNRGYPDSISADERDAFCQDIRQKMFDSFFRLKFRVRVAPSGEDLNRECSLFTEDFRYLIVGSATYVQDDVGQRGSYETHQNNESVEPNPRFPLEDYTIHIIDLKTGRVTDKKSFKSDRIFLSHNQGLYLYNNTLSILSVQHQTITILQVEHGEFVPVRTIGRFCYEDDELQYSQVANFAGTKAKDEAFYTTLKQRLLTYIFKRAHSIANDPDLADLSYMSRFYQYYEQLAKLRLWKMQLLDEDHLLLKYSSEDVVTLRNPEPNTQHCLFVIYCISSTEILAVFENTTEILVDFFENFADHFRNNNLTLDSRYASSPSNNIYAKQMHQKFRHTITSARFGGPVEATKRILTQLPISSQSYSASPYLDQALFSFDEHRVSSMERPKACGEIPIRFYGRDSGIYKFQIHAGMLARGTLPSGRRLVAFTFHPSAPFAISVQRANAEYLVHFHLRLDPHSILPLQ